MFRQDDIEPIYEQRIKQARRDNIENVFDEEETKEKVRNFAERFDCDEMLVWKQMQDDMSFALTFAKDPGKQSIHQHIAADYIKQLPTISNFKELPAGGKNALYCVDGVVVNGEMYKDKVVKSIDFYWEYIFEDKKLEFYATHKRTDRDGGAQDNQFNDVLVFHENAKKCKNKNIVLLSITDGQYYKERYTKDATFSGTRLEYYKDRCCGERSCATSSNGLLRGIIPFIVEWLDYSFESCDIVEEKKRLLEIYNCSLDDK